MISKTLNILVRTSWACRSRVVPLRRMSGQLISPRGFRSHWANLVYGTGLKSESFAPCRVITGVLVKVSKPTLNVTKASIKKLFFRLLICVHLKSISKNFKMLRKWRSRWRNRRLYMDLTDNRQAVTELSFFKHPQVVYWRPVPQGAIVPWALVFLESNGILRNFRIFLGFFLNDNIGKFITWRRNSALNCTWKPMIARMAKGECDFGFQMQFNVEFPRQVMDFPWIA